MQKNTTQIILPIEIMRNIQVDYYTLENFESIKSNYSNMDVCFLLIREIKGFVHHLNDYGFTFQLQKLNLEPWLNLTYNPAVNILGVIRIENIDVPELIDSLIRYQKLYKK